MAQLHSYTYTAYNASSALYNFLMSIHFGIGIHAKSGANIGFKINLIRACFCIEDDTRSLSHQISTVYANEIAFR